MTKFNDEFIDEVQNHWKENKGKTLGDKTGGVHREVKSVKKIWLAGLGRPF